MLFILLFSLFSRLFRLDYPNYTYFDEVYHVSAAMLMSDGNFRQAFDPFQASYDGQNTADWLHPPMAKYFQAFSMIILGKTPLAWRLPSLVFGLLSLVAFYFLLRYIGQKFFFQKLSSNNRKNSSIGIALLGTSLLSLDGLFLVMSRIAMNDVILLLFVLLAVFSYVVRLNKLNSIYLLLVGLFLGLALATKWSALWLLLVLLLHELGRLKDLKKLPFILFCFLITPFFIYVFSYLPAFVQGMSVTEFLNFQGIILSSQLTNPNMHIYSSDPLTWPLNWRPVWFFLASSEFLPLNWTANIYALANPLLSLYLLGTLAIVFASLFGHSKESSSRTMVYFLLTLYLANLLPWIFFKRPLFLHHYLISMAFLFMLLSYFAWNIFSRVKNRKTRQAWVFNFLFWPLFVFIIFYPHWTALAVPSGFANAVYFWLTNWQ